MEKDIKEALLTYYFYPIGNHHTIVITGTSLVKRDVEYCLKEGLSVQEIKDKLFKIISSLEQVEARAWKANESVKNLKDHLNQLIPVTG